MTEEPEVPFQSKAQQRFLESKDSPLSESQKREWESKTNFSKLHEHVRSKMNASLHRKESSETKDKDSGKHNKSEAKEKSTPKISETTKSNFLHSVASKMIAARKSK